MSEASDREASIRRRMAEVVASHGPWTAHSIDLGDGIRTFENPLNVKLLTTLHFIRSCARKPIEELRILDLGCLEGAYAIELGLQKARAVGIEARANNIAKARFAKEVLGLTNVEFHQDDVRNISRERYGTFDFVICAGLLYHLDAPDILPFLERCAEMCSSHLILDTQVACRPYQKFSHRGSWFHGYAFQEFASDVSEAATNEYAWAAHKNRVSFLLTKPSLFAALIAAGFDTVAEAAYPYDGFPFKDYVFAIAGKTTPMTWRSAPELGSLRLPPPAEIDTREAQNPYLEANRVAHPDARFVVPSEYCEEPSRR